MIKKYIYKDKEYLTYQLKQLRQDLFDSDRISIAWPDLSVSVEKMNEVLNPYGITYVEEPDPEIPLETLKQRKLLDLDQAFMQWYEIDATCVSSLGFTIDSDARAMMDVGGLVTKAESQPVETQASYSLAFMDANNVPHAITLDQLKVLRLEIIDAGVAAYNEKWTFRQAINDAQSEEDLSAIQIVFTQQDFSKPVA